MKKNDVKTLEMIAENVERKTRQKNTVNPDNFFMSTLKMTKKAELDEPAWGRTRGGYVDNRLRDEWLHNIVQEEPHLESVLSTSVVLDANRRYRLVGGRNQVLRFAARMDSFEGGKGFRAYQELAAKDYYNADVGSIGEMETERRNGPLLSMYHVDPTRVRLGKDGLLKYDDDIWKPDTYYRIASQKSTLDKYNYLGRSAVSRCLKIAQTMIALVTHNLEKLGYLAPNGILLISAEDITQDMWDEATESRQAIYVTNTGNQYYDELMTIIDRNIKGELIEFSKMPEKFDTFMFTDYMLKAYALAFNRDVRTFWSLNSGNFGGGTEAALQDEKATYAGAAEYILSFQDMIRRFLPKSVLFEYEIEDTRGKLAKAEVEATIINSAKGLFDIGLSQDRVFSWLADRGVIPTEWSEEEEKIVAEMGVIKERNILSQRLLETENVQRAIEYYPSEPIIMYEAGGAEGKSPKITQLWNSGRDAVKRSWAVNADWLDGRTVNRQTQRQSPDFSEYPFIPKSELQSWREQVENRDLTDTALVKIQRKMELRNQAFQRIVRQIEIDDFDGEGSRGDFMVTAGAANYLEQVENPDNDEAAALALALLMLSGEEDLDEDSVNYLLSILERLLPAIVFAYLLDLRRYSNDAEEDAENLHPERWNSRLGFLTQYGILYGADDLDSLRTWTLGKTERHCSDCAELDGVTKTVAEWIEDGRIPQGGMLECGGFNCDCSFV
jgi:hypothetical protein